MRVTHALTWGVEHGDTAVISMAFFDDDTTEVMSGHHYGRIPERSDVDDVIERVSPKFQRINEWEYDENEETGRRFWKAEADPFETKGK